MKVTLNTFWTLALWIAQIILFVLALTGVVIWSVAAIPSVIVGVLWMIVVTYAVSKKLFS